MEMLKWWCLSSHSHLLNSSHGVLREAGMEIPPMISYVKFKNRGKPSVYRKKINGHNQQVLGASWLFWSTHCATVRHYPGMLIMDMGQIMSVVLHINIWSWHFSLQRIHIKLLVSGKRFKSLCFQRQLLYENKRLNHQVHYCYRPKQ